jgi:hypothetical protein
MAARTHGTSRVLYDYVNERKETLVSQVLPTTIHRFLVVYNQTN